MSTSRTGYTARILAFVMPVAFAVGFIVLNDHANEARHVACENANERWGELGAWLESLPAPVQGRTPEQQQQFDRLLKVTKEHPC